MVRVLAILEIVIPMRDVIMVVVAVEIVEVIIAVVVIIVVIIVTIEIVVIDVLVQVVVSLKVLPLLDSDDGRVSVDGFWLVMSSI